MGIVARNLDTLKENDLYSIALFTLYKLGNDSEYSTLSELSYILDKDSLLKLCQYYGGLSIKIPTIDDLKIVMKSLACYQMIKVEHKDEEETLVSVNNGEFDLRKLKNTYNKICDIMENYNFSCR